MELCRLATIILVMATTNDLDFVFILVLATVSVLIGNHQPIGAARTKRVNVLDGDHRVPGSRRSHGSEGPHLRGHYKGIHDDENNVSL